MSLDKSPGKRERVEIVTTRIRPELKYLAELAARSQRRSLSSFLEWCVEDALKRFRIEEPATLQKQIDALLTPNGPTIEEGEWPKTAGVADLMHPSAWERRADVWDEDEGIRFCKLVRQFPYLLTTEERAVMSVIANTDHWRVLRLRKPPQADINFLREHWTQIKEIAETGKATPPNWPRRAGLHK